MTTETENKNSNHYSESVCDGCGKSIVRVLPDGEWFHSNPNEQRFGDDRARPNGAGGYEVAK